MAALLLGIYISLIFIRPMDWYGPLIGWRLVTFTAIATLITAWPKIMNEHQRLWRSLPELRVALFLLFGVSISWIWPFWMTGIRTTFQEFGKIIILYFLILLLAKDVKNYRTLLWIILGCVVWMAIHSILQHQRGFGFGAQRPRWRADSEVYQSIAFGIFEDPNDLCTVFVVAIPLLYAVVRAEKNFIYRGFALGLIPTIGYAAWLTNSRGGIMGIFGMFVAYALGRTRNKTWRLLIAVVAVTFVTTIAPSRFGKGLAGGGRLIPWGDGIAAWRSHPIFGVGYGDFGTYASEGKAAHNSYIHALTEWGIVGYIPFFLLIYLTVLHVRRAINLKAAYVSRQNQIYLSGMYSAIVGYLTVIYFLSRQDGHVLYILLGMATCAALIVCREPEAFQAVFGPYQRDIQKGVRYAFISIPLLWITIKIGYALGIG